MGIIEQAVKENQKVFESLRRFREGNPTKEDIQEQIDLEQRQIDAVKNGRLCPYSQDGTQSYYCSTYTCKYAKICKAYLKTH